MKPKKKSNTPILASATAAFCRICAQAQGKPCEGAEVQAPAEG